MAVTHAIRIRARFSNFTKLLDFSFTKDGKERVICGYTQEEAETNCELYNKGWDFIYEPEPLWTRPTVTEVPPCSTNS